jgi:hypothetical protein
MRTCLRRRPTCLKVSETVHEQRDRASQTHLTNDQDHLSEVTQLIWSVDSTVTCGDQIG